MCRIQYILLLNLNPVQRNRSTLMVSHVDYFLSTTELGRDRVNSYVVEQSIEAQVKRLHPEVHAPGSNLRGLLEACATYYKNQDKPFVLVLDGLDYVWRINNADKRPLDDVFSQLIPCSDNMGLLVGTQLVDDAQLPRDLLSVVPKASWRTLPAMSENVVLPYLRKAIDEGRLSCPVRPHCVHQSSTSLIDMPE